VSFVQLSGNHELVSDYCWNMSKFTLYMTIYVCMLLGFELVWLFVKFEWKWEKYEFLVKSEFDDDFDVKWSYDSMLVCVLIAFWSMLTDNKVWGTNLWQSGSKLKFLGENGMGSWDGNPKSCFYVIGI